MGADLWRANLKEANLMGAILVGANLTAAHLPRTDLRGAYLEGAILMGAYFEGAINLTIEQLSQAKTLYKGKLDPELEKQMKEKYPHLLEKPKEEEKEIKEKDRGARGPEAPGIRKDAAHNIA